MEVLELVGLKNKVRQYPDQLSGGEQQMLAIARAMMSKPKIILLDEPSMGLAPIIVNEVFEIILLFICKIKKCRTSCEAFFFLL